jgi:hypothetical protein
VRRERRKGKKFLIYRVGISMEFRAKIKIQSISSVETGVPGDKPLQAKLREDFFSLSVFLCLHSLQGFLQFSYS